MKFSVQKRALWIAIAAMAALNFVAADVRASQVGSTREDRNPGTARAEIRNHSTWRDTAGDLIDCHEGGILRVGDTFYWYGRAYRGNVDGIYGAGGARFRCGFNCYSSTNLASWTYHGAILSYPPSGFLTAGTWHRPRVLHNHQSGKYVLWFFMFPTGTQRFSTLVVATAPHPTGPFKVLTGPDFGESGDLALLEAEDGHGYIAFDEQMRRSVRVTRLTADFLNLTGSTTLALQAGDGKSYEAASMVRYKGKYIVAGSGVEGLKPTETSYAVADAPLGPYTYKGFMSREKTWKSQLSAFFYLVESDRLIALCEQWLTGPGGERAPAERSCQLWLPVTFDPATGVARMQHVQRWDPWLRELPQSRHSEDAASVLGIDGTSFTINGRKTFLLGASFYGALGAPDEFILRDLEDLRKLGFNWIRVWAVWDAFHNNVSAVDTAGNPREPYLAKLKAIVAAAEKRGMVVDVTLARMPCLPDKEAHLRAVETLAQALKDHRNVYFDLANERDQNYAGGSFVSYAELKTLRDRVKAIDPDRLVTASGEPTGVADLRNYLVEAGLDFVSPHLARDVGTEKRTADTTRKLLGWMNELGRAAPIHYQEPFRRDYLDYRGFWQPEVETFCTDLRNAKLSGAAGWCFHNGSPSPTDRFPAGKRRSFDMRVSQGSLMDQLDAVERQFLTRAASCLQ